MTSLEPVSRSKRPAARPVFRQRHCGRLLPSVLFTVISILIPGIGLSQSLDPNRIGWSELRFHASKCFISVDAEVELSDVPAGQLDSLLMEPGEGVAVAPSGPTKELVFTTAAFGRRTRAELLLNARSGGTLQRTSHDSGKRFRHRIYRYTDIGAYQRTRWPVGEDEENLPADQWEQWSEVGEDLRPYPEAVHGKVVTDPGALLYIVGAAPLDKVGDTIEILAYVRKHVHRVQIEVAGMEQLKVDYNQVGGADAGTKKGKHQALKLLVRGESVDDGDSENEFELLGLRGDIDLHIDPETRAPLQIEGRVKIAGHTIMRLEYLKIDEK